MTSLLAFCFVGFVIYLLPNATMFGALIRELLISVMMVVGFWTSTAVAQFLKK
ncbi:hypothetical protein HN803_04130 [candidate division WWE3 bacterium]|jgi:hypothetical protein|nr:hypothetical protein [candidate division WWE3 bacterium]